MIFAATMRKTPEECLLMGFDMMATARELARTGIAQPNSDTLSDGDQRLLFQRSHNAPPPW